MTTVVGIDPSLTGTGVAGVGISLCWSITIKTVGKRGDSLADRDDRLGRIADRIVEHATGARLVVIEGPAMSRSVGSIWDRAGLWWRVVHRLRAADMPVAVCPPNTRAKWATGKGTADKAAVASAMTKLWPGAELDDDNQSDALALATLGMQWLVGGFPRLARHAAAFDAVEWPANLDQGAA